MSHICFPHQQMTETCVVLWSKVLNVQNYKCPYHCKQVFFISTKPKRILYVTDMLVTSTTVKKPIITHVRIESSYQVSNASMVGTKQLFSHAPSHSIWLCCKLACHIKQHKKTTICHVPIQSSKRTKLQMSSSKQHKNFFHMHSQTDYFFTS